jgi:hypothetical protein
VIKPGNPDTIHLPKEVHPRPKSVPEKRMDVKAKVASSDFDIPLRRIALDLGR